MIRQIRTYEVSCNYCTDATTRVESTGLGRPLTRALEALGWAGGADYCDGGIMSSFECPDCRVRRARPVLEPGCYVAGHWGQYGVARMVAMAEDHGYPDERVKLLARKKIDSMQPSAAVGLTDGEEEELSDAADKVEEWLNVNVAPEDHSFGWHDGEFYLWSDDDWSEV